ncbi:MAG: dienelactone hydrolase family protein [Chloroflexaceae bacterium]
MERKTSDAQREHAVMVAAGSAWLEGLLGIPSAAHGVVICAHASGSSRYSDQQRATAGMLRAEGLATLLLDLFTAEEEALDARMHHLKYDIGLLAERLIAVTDWLTGYPDTHHLPVGYFGAGTGIGAALVAAAERAESVGAVVSQSGRPDLADLALHRVRAPTLLLVGGKDFSLMALSRTALEHIHGEKELTVIPGVADLFEEPDRLEAVVQAACAWFNQHLVPLHEAQDLLVVDV